MAVFVIALDFLAYFQSSSFLIHSLVLDGTYIYIQKTADLDLQSRTFSPHKHRNLTKFMMVTMRDGYIIDATGPYFADSKKNDASILATYSMRNRHRLFTALLKLEIIFSWI